MFVLFQDIVNHCDEVIKETPSMHRFKIVSVGTFLNIKQAETVFHIGVEVDERPHSVRIEAPSILKIGDALREFIKSRR